MVVRKKNTMSKKIAMDIVKKSTAQISSKGIGSNIIYGMPNSIKLHNQLPNKCTTG